MDSSVHTIAVIDDDLRVLESLRFGVNYFFRI